MQNKTGDTGSVTGLREAFAKSSSAQERFDYFKSHPRSFVDENVAEQLAEMHVVLVAGYGGPYVKAGEDLLNREEEKRYFGQLKKNLEIVGASVTVIHPHAVTIEASAEKLIRRAPELYRAGGNKPLVILGHSRGGMVALETAIKAPQLIRKGIIKKFATLQSPVNGNGLLGAGIEVAARAGLGFLKPAGNLGLGALGGENIQRLFGASAFRRLPLADQKLVSDSILWFVGGTEKALGMLKTVMGPSDGLVALRDQRRKEYGFIGGYFNKVSHVNAIIDLGPSLTRSPSEALALAMMEILAQNVAGGPEYAKRVSEAEEKKLQDVLKKGRLTL